MQRIIVDLPEPDGPITTTTSWRPMRRSMSLSAWNAPKNLLTPSSSIITSPAPATWVASANTLRRSRPRRPSLAARSLALARSHLDIVDVRGHLSHPQLALEPLALAAHRVRHRPEQQRGEGDRLTDQALAAELALLRDHLGDREQVEQAHRRAGQGGVLEQADQLTDLGRDHVAQRLRQHDQHRLAHRRQPERLGRLVLATGHRLQPAADDLGHVRGGEQREHDDRPRDRRRRQFARDEELQRDVGEQQQHEQRSAADDLDVRRRHRPDQRQLRAPPEGEEHPEREAQHDRAQRRGRG